MPTNATKRYIQAKAKQVVSSDTKAAVLEMPLHIRARTDFFAYAEYLGKPVPAHIKPWVEAVVTEKSSGRLLRVAGPNTNILAPRGSAKSVFIGLITSWLIGIHTVARKPFFTLYISYNQKLANTKSKAMKNLIASEAYKKVFPEVRISKSEKAEARWSIDYDFAGINVLGEVAITCVAAGLDSSITGFRAHWAVIDDCIKSAKSIANPEVRAELSNNWRQVLKPILYEGARAVCVGTRFLPQDIHATDFCEQHGWRVIVQPALIYDSLVMKWESYWPKESEEAYGFTVDFLLELRRTDPIGFAYQYQQEAVITSDLSISPELIRRAIIYDLNEYEKLVLAIDLSATNTERSDYTAFVLAGRRAGKYHIIDSRQCRSLGNIEKLMLITDMLLEWNFIYCLNPEESEWAKKQFRSTSLDLVLAVESNAYQASMAHDIRSDLINKHFLDNIIVKQITRNRGDKLAHFRNITSVFGTIKFLEDGSKEEVEGCLFFNAFLKMQALLDQILNIGATDHDDLLDAFVIALNELILGMSEVDFY